ncbi:MAG: hemerythrin domain-containing protein [Chloroflexi bacterium]|nr:hemerythrin domain-containing protein [Chloroflexota bacterium]
MRSLPETTHEHHDRIDPHVDRLPVLAGMIGRVPPAELAAALDGENRFIASQLVPHIEAIETTLYRELERLMDERHSMEPMRREHRQLRRLFDTFDVYVELARSDCLGDAEGMGLRRVLFRLYSLLRVHLAEEELYLQVLERNLSPEEKDALARGIDHAAAEPL